MASTCPARWKADPSPARENHSQKHRQGMWNSDFAPVYELTAGT